MQLTEYPDREALMLGLAGRVASGLRLALARGGRATLALPGGATPGPLFDILSGTDLDWARIDILPTDERLVPPGDLRSNAGLIAARLLHGHAAAARLLPLDAPGAAEALAARLPLDLVVLGIGADGHIASLFSGAPELLAALAADAPPLMRLSPPGQPEARLSLTAPVLTGAGTLHLLITGAAKRETLARAAEKGSVAGCPVRLVLNDAEIHFAE